ncbi:MAG TPA: AAA family ATPase [Candidatus Limnocylindria bacterium]|nr:AAA family ATPase [Candidatus Limnocylindria bacterium]
MLPNRSLIITLLLAYAAHAHANQPQLSQEQPVIQAPEKPQAPDAPQAGDQPKPVSALTSEELARLAALIANAGQAQQPEKPQRALAEPALAAPAPVSATPSPEQSDTATPLDTAVVAPAKPKPTRELIRTLPGMVGQQPKILCWLMTQFKDTETRSKIFLNRLLLYGPPGTGKSTIGRKFAEATGSIFLARSASSMVEKFVGQGATNVATLFEEARKRSFEEGKQVVVFIDEIDSLAGPNNTEFRAEHKAALQQLWIELDMCKNDPNIFVIFATNEFKKLSKTFIDRLGYNTLEIKLPDQDLRKRILAYYFERAELAIDDALLNKLAKKTNDLSNRALEDMVYGIAMATDLQGYRTLHDSIVWDVLKNIKEKFKNNTNDQDEQDKKLQKTSTWVSIVSGVLSSSLNTIQLGNYLATLGAAITIHRNWDAIKAALQGPRAVFS